MCREPLPSRAISAQHQFAPSNRRALWGALGLGWTLLRLQSVHAKVKGRHVRPLPGCLSVSPSRTRKVEDVAHRGRGPPMWNRPRSGISVRGCGYLRSTTS